MSDDPPVLMHWDGEVCRLVLNRPASGNALSPMLVQALGAALDVAQDRDCGLLIIEGSGRHFCTGFDLSALEHETDDMLLARFVHIELLLQRVARAPFPTLALVRGRAMGAGADLLVACRTRVALAGAAFAFPGARGFGLALGSRRLAAAVGAERARDWIGSARLIDDAEALRCGLITNRLDAEPAPHTLQALAGAHVEPDTPRLVAQALSGNAVHDDAADLAALVRSAAEPGLRARLVAYVARSRPRT